MATIDDEIDALYRLSLDTFTAERNELARRAGDRAAEVRKLVKPSAAAWAVNQLYWRRRPVFDALAKASEARRTAHIRQLSGREADVAVADARHRASLDAAIDATVAFLKESGDAVSPATLDALTQTLEAVPAPEINGRLTRPLSPAGFSTLASLLTGTSRPPSRPPADVVVIRNRHGRGSEERTSAEAHGQPDRTKKVDAARREAATRARERERLKKEVARAKQQERDAATALAKARQAAERAIARVDELDAELVEARKKLSESHDAAERARAAVNKAAAARVTLERQLQEFEEG